MDLAQLLAPPPISYIDQNVVPQGLRILVSTEQPQDNALVSRIDIPPSLNQLKISGGNRSAISSAVRSSLWLSANEALAYDQSAFAQLQGRPLQLMDRYTGGIPEESAKRFTPEAAALLRRVADQYIDYIRLIPTDGGTVAMWVINYESGTVMAVGETGRGEGSRKLSTTEFAFAIGIAELLGFYFFCASVDCELGAEKAHPFRCAGYASGAIFATAASMLVRGHLLHPHFDLPTIAESILTALHVNLVSHALLHKSPIEAILKSLGSSNNEAKMVVAACIAYFVAHLFGEPEARDPRYSRPPRPRRPPTQ